MSTIIYITRHSIPMNMYPLIKNSDEFQIKNEKQIPSVEGEKRAKKLSELEELKEENVSLRQSLSFWKDRFLKVISFIKDRLFEKQKERDKYMDFADDL